MEEPVTPAANKAKLTKEVSVMAWIENQFGDVLLLKQKAGRGLWTLPGGKVRRRELLGETLRREVMEETGFKIHSPALCGLFERPEKDVLTFVYRVRIKGTNDIVYPNNEIETAKFSSVLPRNSTPSLIYFWKRFGPGSKHEPSLTQPV